MRAYPEYKDSEVEWVDTVPVHWDIKRFKNIFSIRKDIAGTLGFDILSITQKGIKVKDIESGAGQVASDYTKYQKVDVGDFAMNHMDLLTGFVDISKYDGVTSPDYRVFFLKEKLADKSYYLYILQLCYTNKIFYPLGQGAAHVGRWRLPADAFKEFRSPLPPEKEQLAIAKYLDRETIRIDKLISEKQNFIKLLKEKRQSLISHVITKGLDPMVKMKDSGVEWIGEVPEHWVAKPLKHIISTRKGIAFKSDCFCDEGVPVIKASDIKNKTLRSSGICLPNNFKLVFPKAVLNHKEIVLSTVGSLPEVKNSAVGQIGIVPESLDGSLLNQNTVVFTALQQHVLPEYLLLLLQLPSYREHLDLNAHGTANQASLNIVDMLSFVFYLPSINEQIKLVDGLSKELNKLETLEFETNNSIYLLKEHRTALISAAVTGKIDVRDHVQ